MVDETSQKVLEEYLQDSRQSFREVARKIGISSGTVANRIKDLEEKEIIKKYTTQLDYEKLGYEKTGPFGLYQEDPLSVFMYKKLF